MAFVRFLSLVTALTIAFPAIAQDETAPNTPPRLVIAISIDQLSSDIFTQYRAHYTGGFARLLRGAVFPSGYQAHAATETCPGHSTILTGAHPARNGIIANRWFDMDVEREDVRVYCAEDVTVEGSSSTDYTRSNRNLLVPTLGDLLRLANEDSRTVSVAGKDRSAIMLGGGTMTAYWPGRAGFGSYAETQTSAAANQINQQLAVTLSVTSAPYPIPAVCEAANRTIPLDAENSVGTGRFVRAAGDVRGLLATPEADLMTLNLASALVAEQQLGQREATDVLAIGLAATDYIGHNYGTHGLEQCIQLMSLDAMLGAFFDDLDAQGLSYVVVLTADHGGLDLPERQAIQGAPDAARLSEDFAALVGGITEGVGLEGPVLHSEGPFGDFYVDRDVPEERRAEVIDRAVAAISNHPQVYRVYLREEIAPQPIPTAPPEQWTVLDRVRASFHPDRSGDFVVTLRPRVTPIPDPIALGYVATHGSPWDYDRRVPIMFWWNGVEHFEQPLGVMTVDIMPTLASLVGLDISETEIDGRCLDLMPGVTETNCQ